MNSVELSKENDFYSANLKVLKVLHPDLHHLLGRTSPVVTMTDSLSGTVTLPHECKILFTLGVGNGQWLKPLESLHSLDQWVILEKSIECFKHALCVTDLRNLLLKDNIHWWIGLDSDEIKGRMFDLMRPTKRLYFSRAMEVILNPDISQTDQSLDYYVRAARALKEGLAFRVTTAKVDPQDTLIGLKNIIKNQGRFYSSANFDTLQNQFRGVPGIVLASGPSLSHSIPFLKGISNRAVIAGVSSNARLIIEEGLRPHFISVVERMPGHARLIEGIKPRSTRLLALPLVDPKSFNAFDDRVLSILRQVLLFEWLPSPYKQHYFGSSSALLSFYALTQLGCDPIILVGQDLAFSGNNTHASGADMKRPSIDMLKEGEKIKVMGNNGQTVLTSPLWLKFKNVYEKLIAQWGGTCINAIPKNMGAEIIGAERRDPDQVFQRIIHPAPDCQIENRMDALLGQKDFSFADEWSRALKTKSAKTVDELIRMTKTDLVQDYSCMNLEEAYQHFQNNLQGSDARNLLFDVSHPRILDLMGRYFELPRIKPDVQNEQKELLQRGLKDVADFAQQIIQTLSESAESTSLQHQIG